MLKREYCIVMIVLLSASLLCFALDKAGRALGYGASEVVLFGDDFESCEVGTFPSGNGWELWFNGMGTQYQVVVDSASSSPTKSLHLLGRNYNAALAAKRFVSNASCVGFHASVRVETSLGRSGDNARLAFTKLAYGGSCEIALVAFNDDGTIEACGKRLQNYTVGQWYTVREVLNRTSQKASIWIDGELKGESLNVTATSLPVTPELLYSIEAFSVSQCCNAVDAYFDDVEVFEILPAPPVLATVDFCPNALNLASVGNWFISYVELPEGYNVTDIDVSTVQLNKTVSADSGYAVYGDHDGNGVGDVRVRFNRTNVIDYMESLGISYANVTLTMTGGLFNGTLLTGGAVLRVSNLVGDVKCDGRVGMYDLLKAASIYASREGSENWNPNANIAPPWDMITIRDLVTVAAHYGERQP